MEQSDELLVPLVNAPHQRAAVERALAVESDPAITVLNVLTPLDAPLSEGRVLRVTGERRDDARDRARRMVETASDRSGPASSGDDSTPNGGDSVVDVAVAEGRPARTVADHATERDVDRIVVGDRDRSPLSTLVFGRSVATSIDDRTDVPVTVVDDLDD